MYPQKIHEQAHYSDVIMNALASQITGVSIVAQPFLQAQIKKLQSSTSLWRESNGDRWISSQKASNMENVSIWWRHHENWDLIRVWLMCITIKQHGWSFTLWILSSLWIWINKSSFFKSTWVWWAAVVNIWLWSKTFLNNLNDFVHRTKQKRVSGSD